MKAQRPDKNKPEIKPVVPVQPVIPEPHPEINPVPEKQPSRIKPELPPNPEPLTKPGKEEQDDED